MNKEEFDEYQRLYDKFVDAGLCFYCGKEIPDIFDYYSIKKHKFTGTTHSIHFHIDCFENEIDKSFESFRLFADPTLSVIYVLFVLSWPDQSAIINSIDGIRTDSCIRLDMSKVMNWVGSEIIEQIEEYHVTV